jgi:hypothetical protein
VTGVREQEIQVGEEEPTRTEVLLMSMAGVLSTKSVALSIPSVSRRIFGPHVGTQFTKYHPSLKLARIYLKKREDKDASKVVCSVTGKLMRSGSIHNPG